MLCDLPEQVAVSVTLTATSATSLTINTPQAATIKITSPKASLIVINSPICNSVAITTNKDCVVQFGGRPADSVSITRVVGSGQFEEEEERTLWLGVSKGVLLMLSVQATLSYIKEKKAVSTRVSEIMQDSMFDSSS